MIRGIDIHESLIEAANNLSLSIAKDLPQNIRFEFAVNNIEDEIAAKLYKFDTIHVGVALAHTTYDALIENIFAE